MILKNISFLALIMSLMVILSSCTVLKNIVIYSDEMITFNTNQGVEIDPIPILRWKETVLPKPIREGYEFLGWYDNPEFLGEPILSITFGDLEDVILYAKWDIKVYHIYYGILNDDTFVDDQPYLYPGEYIIDAHLGLNHAGAVTSYGRLFMWGSNDVGQLGDGTFIEHIKPIDITSRFFLEYGEKITKISLGDKHSVAVTSFNRVFTWGSNEDGQLGNKSFVNEITPYEITHLFKFQPNESVEKVRVGYIHNALLTSNHRLFTWGGEHGLGGSGSQEGHFPTNITPYIMLEEGEVIDEMSLDRQSMTIHTSQNHLVSCGRMEFKDNGYSPIESDLLASEEEFSKFINYYTTAVGLTNKNQVIYFTHYTYKDIEDKTIWVYYEQSFNHLMNLEEDEHIIDIYHVFGTIYIYTSFNRYLHISGNGDYQEGDSIENRFRLYNDLNTIYIDEEETLNQFILSHSSTGGLITSNHVLYTWGSNYDKTLGYTDERDQNTPYPVFLHVDLYHVDEFMHGNSVELYIPTRDSYTFSGWFIDPACTIEFDHTKTYEENLYVYGRWYE